MLKFPGLGVYVGSAWNLRNRLAEHVHLLGQGEHRNRELQAAWDRTAGVGLSCTWRVLEGVEHPEELCFWENRLMAYWVDQRRARLLNQSAEAVPYTRAGKIVRRELRRPVGQDGKLLV